MHGDEMAADSSDEEEEKEPSDRALIPFEPDDHSTPGDGLRILPCPARLPHRSGFEIHRWNGVRTAVLTLASGPVRTRHPLSQELLEHHVF